MISFYIDNITIKKYKNIWTDLQNIQLSALLVYDGIYIETKIRTWSKEIL